MKFYLNDNYFIDTSEPIDISMSLESSEKNPRAWYVDAPQIEPVRTENWTGSVVEGGAVNFRNISFNPHGHGTHTECLGHITEEVFSVNNSLKQYFFWAELISVEPRKIQHSDGKEDEIVFSEQISIQHSETEALIVRTLPNLENKKNRNYSDTNPAYFDPEVVSKLEKNSIEHFLVDTPSVDRESDNGVLAFHHRFWQVPEKNNHLRTITEMIFVDNSIKDGQYILEIQLAPFENDASPSRPVLYEIKKRG